MKMTGMRLCFFLVAPMGNLCVCVLYRCFNVMQRVIQLRKWINENNCIVLNKNNGFQSGFKFKCLLIFSRKCEYVFKYFVVVAVTVFIKIVRRIISLSKKENRYVNFFSIS